MPDIGNIPVKCPVCGNYIVIPVVAALISNNGKPELNLTVDEDRWSVRLQTHLQVNHE